MPIYEYRCHECGEKFEVLVFSHTERIICDKCGSEATERLMSSFASTGSSSEGGASSCGGSGRFS